MNTQTPKKPRNKTLLPTEIKNGDSMLSISDLNLAQLGEAQKVRKDFLDNFDKETFNRTKSELKAINKAIKERAK